MNTSSSLLLQAITLISGFILPRLILRAYGSEVNGLVNSITQFLAVISLMDLGVGSVVESSLYGPLSRNDNVLLSQIYVSATKFFQRLAFILLFYVVILMGVYPILVNESFDYIYIVALIATMCISSFAQYYFGIVNGLVLTADQKSYIQNGVRIVTVVLSTVVCCIQIKQGGSIQQVKLITSLIFLCQPFFFSWYIKHHYTIDKTIKCTDEPITQKWNGMAQHFAYYILTSTDNIVLTVFSTLENVSIYAVYSLVINGVKNVIQSFTQGFKSIIGEMIAKNEQDKLKQFFYWIEWVIHTTTTLFFGCTGVLIVPFVQVYTNSITDTNYYQPLFAILITLANAGHCLRLPYNSLILAAGHYKQTQRNHIISSILNIVISVATVKIWGLIGVAIGTLIAMFYQTIWMAWYDSKNIIKCKMDNFFRQCFVDILIIILASIVTSGLSLVSISYRSWFIFAMKIFSIWMGIALIVNMIFNRHLVQYTLKRLTK